jgi:hypothetical protein
VHRIVPGQAGGDRLVKNIPFADILYRNDFQGLQMFREVVNLQAQDKPELVVAASVPEMDLTAVLETETVVVPGTVVVVPGTAVVAAQNSSQTAGLVEAAHFGTLAAFEVYCRMGSLVAHFPFADHTDRIVPGVAATAAVVVAVAVVVGDLNQDATHQNSQDNDLPAQGHILDRFEALDFLVPSYPPDTDRLDFEILDYPDFPSRVFCCGPLHYLLHPK